MGLLSFLKNTGSKVFGAESPEEKSEKIKTHLYDFGLDISMLNISVEDQTVTLSGKVKNLEEKHKIAATAGNIEGISQVNDQTETVEVISFALPDIQEAFYTVKKGDTLSKISKEVYGDANRYQKIFEANQPMLKHPDKIYPGQVLCIPQD